LNSEVTPRIAEYVGGVVRNLKGQLIAANGPADHIHLVAMVHPTLSISEFLGKLKSNSSGWIHDTLPGLADFDWQDGYAAFTVSKSGVPDVVRYVERQEEHHRKMTFQEELIQLLDRHGIEYDPRYIWR
jgi:REP element-mobilizing transposase RayT